MAEYIDKKLLIGVLKNREECVDCTDTDCVDCMCDFIACIVPSDVAEVRHGKWETDKEDLEWGNALKKKHCSVCNARPFFDRDKWEFILTDYCPNCGTKMDLGDDVV